MAKPNMLELCARQKLQQPDTWLAYRYEVKNHGTPGAYYEVKGAITPLKTRGKNKGQPNWGKLDKSTDFTAAIQFDQLAAFIKQWEADTGLCHKCGGTGQEFAEWSADEGTKTRPCMGCNTQQKTPQ
jgi:hypothetical protein